MTGKNISYKELHEAFMRDHNGTTIFENFILISSGPPLVFFSCCIYTLLTLSTASSLTSEKLLSFILDYIVIIVGLVLNFTLFSNYSLEYLIGILSIYFCCVIYLFIFNQPTLIPDHLNKSFKKPFITYFRSIVNIITAICILAVDFNIFPRRFAKAENFGYGLMDTGVGFYIVTNGIVTHFIPCNKNKLNFTFKTFLSIIPLLFLGAVRLFSIKAIDYQTHVSEYGVHWNFFFTLAFVKLFSSILLLYFNNFLFILALLVTISHQYLLSNGLQNWAMSPISRDNLFTANREGIISLPGYLSLFFFSLVLGDILKNVVTVKDRIKYFILFTILLGSLLYLLSLSEFYFPNTRRFANATYVLWILSMSVYIIIICFLFEISLQLFYSVVNCDSVLFIPRILDSINYNGLVFFLSANLLTGIVNILVKTLYVKDTNSVIILCCYMFINCLITSLLHHYKIRLKWW